MATRESLFRRSFSTSSEFTKD